MNSEAIAQKPDLFALLRQQALALLAIYAQNPRLASVFATQQRWLLGHTAFALYFRGAPTGPQRGLISSRLFEQVQRHALGSPNTADTFLKEMEKYGFIEPIPNVEDRRARPLQPTAAAYQALRAWLQTHLATLDGLDAGDRLAAFAEAPQALARIQPLIADALLSNGYVRTPGPIFSLFTWLNNGGVIMEWLLVNMDQRAIGTPCIPVGLVPMDDFASWLRLSRKIGRAHV